MTSSDRVGEDGTLKPPEQLDRKKYDYLNVPEDKLQMLHAEQHRGVFVPDLDSCEQHDRQEFARDFGYVLVEQQAAQRGVQPGVGDVTTERDDMSILPPPTYKLRGAITHIMLGHEDRAIKIVKTFSAEECRDFLNALDTLSAMLIARVSIEYIDEMLQVEP